METIVDHKSLIDALGGNAEVARFGDWLPVTVGQWKAQNRIPPEQWPKLIELSAERAVAGIDSNWFMRTWPARKNAAGTESTTPEPQADAA